MRITEMQKGNILDAYVQKETVPSAFSNEINFYATIKSGDIDAVKTAMQHNPFGNEYFTELSENPLQSLKYHFVITAAMLARFCIEGGMAYGQAYELSDIYIRRADKATSKQELIKYHIDMCMNYTKEMNIKHKHQVFSKPIVMCIDYIYSHLHNNLTLTELASVVNLNPSYLSRLFKSQIGIPISKYIVIRKLEVAQKLLRYSQYSSSEISQLLAFSSQSHFVHLFHSETGLTPLEYRNRYYNNIDLDI